MRFALMPLAWVYGFIIALRNALFDAGWFGVTGVGVPVISVGNISTGGTGKTPIVEELARFLVAEGFRVAVLSRGYGRSTSGFRWVIGPGAESRDPALCGDEPVQIAQNVPGAIVAVDENRARGAETLVREGGAQVILLDDGFQHRWIRRDLDIVVLRKDELDNRGWLLPAGRMREPARALSRAGAVVVTGVADQDQERRAALLLSALYAGPAFFGSLETNACVGLDGTELPLSQLEGMPVLAVSGIGYPGGFERTLRNLRCEVRAHERFPDHHPYTKDDVDRLRRMVETLGTESIVTTQKDAIRLSRISVGPDAHAPPIRWLRVRMRWLSGYNEFMRLTASIARRHASVS